MVVFFFTVVFSFPFRKEKTVQIGYINDNESGKLKPDSSATIGI